MLTLYVVGGVQKLKVSLEPPTRPATTLRENPDVYYQRCLHELRSKDKAIEGHIYLKQLKHADEHMFYKIPLENMAEVTPLIYTPAVGNACLQYSANFRRSELQFVTYKDKGNGRAARTPASPSSAANGHQTGAQGARAIDIVQVLFEDEIEVGNKILYRMLSKVVSAISSP